MKYIVALACLILLGCPSSPSEPERNVAQFNGVDYRWDLNAFPIPVYIPKEYDPAWKEQVRDAVMVWNMSAQCNLFYEREVTIGHVMFQLGLVYPGTVTVEEYNLTARKNSGESHMVLWSPERGGASGRLHHVKVLLDEGLSEEKLFTVALHELGHVLTLAHDSDESSIMHTPSVIGSIIEPEDLEIVRKKAGCLDD